MSLYSYPIGLFIFALILLQLLQNTIVLSERLIIRLLIDFIPPVMKPLLSWCQRWSLAILTLHSTQTVALNSRDWSLFDLENDFDNAKTWFEGEVAKEVSKGLKSVDGVLAQFSMGHST